MGVILEELRTTTGLMGQGFVTVLEAATFLRLSRAKVYALIENKELQYVEFGKSRRIPWQADRPSGKVFSIRVGYSPWCKEYHEKTRTRPIRAARTAQANGVGS